MLERGTQVIYIPSHAEGKEDHPDVEAGFITSVRDDRAFCRYWSKYSCELRTKSCSELTPIANLVVQDTVPQREVQLALERYC